MLFADEQFHPVEALAFCQTQQPDLHLNRVGSHKILLGESENIEDKLNRLEVFYKETIGKQNWNKYTTLDLRFKDQVVCKEINY